MHPQIHDHFLPIRHPIHVSKNVHNQYTAFFYFLKLASDLNYKWFFKRICCSFFRGCFTTELKCLANPIAEFTYTYKTLITKMSLIRTANSTIYICLYLICRQLQVFSAIILVAVYESTRRYSVYIVNVHSV